MSSRRRVLPGFANAPRSTPAVRAVSPLAVCVEIVAELVDILGERLVFEVDGRDSRGRIVSGRVELLG